MRKPLAVLAALAMTAMVSACASGPRGPVMSFSDFQQRYPVSGWALGPGDKIKLALFGDDALTGEYDVTQDGTITFPLIGAISAQGLTTEQFSRQVEQALSRGYYKNPRISVQIINLQPIYVHGEVNTAGSFPYVPDLTLGKAVALSGGYSYRARMDVVAIRRGRSDGEVFVSANQSMPLAPGDTVRILERSF